MPHLHQKLFALLVHYVKHHKKIDAKLIEELKAVGAMRSDANKNKSAIKLISDYCPLVELPELFGIKVVGSGSPKEAGKSHLQKTLEGAARADTLPGTSALKEHVPTINQRRENIQAYFSEMDSLLTGPLRGQGIFKSVADDGPLDHEPADELDSSEASTKNQR